MASVRLTVLDLLLQQNVRQGHQLQLGGEKQEEVWSRGRGGMVQGGQWHTEAVGKGSGAGGKPMQDLGDGTWQGSMPSAQAVLGEGCPRCCHPLRVSGSRRKSESGAGPQRWRGGGVSFPPSWAREAPENKLSSCVPSWLKGAEVGPCSWEVRAKRPFLGGRAWAGVGLEEQRGGLCPRFAPKSWATCFS